MDFELGNYGDGQDLEVISITTNNVNFENGDSRDKIILSCRLSTGQEINISEAWVDYRKEKTVNGLWVKLNSKNQIIPNSTLGKLLKYNKITSLNELVGKTIKGYPDENGFTVLTTYDMEDNQ